MWKAYFFPNVVSGPKVVLGIAHTRVDGEGFASLLEEKADNPLPKAGSYVDRVIFDVGLWGKILHAWMFYTGEPPKPAPMRKTSPIVDRSGSDHRIIMLPSKDLARSLKIARTNHVTLNDILLAAILSAECAYHKLSPASDLDRANVIIVRDMRTYRPPYRSQNEFSYGIANLPCADPPCKSVVEEISKVMNKFKTDQRHLY
jgi:NRPS condensation-like uncharacterized protein